MTPRAAGSTSSLAGADVDPATGALLSIAELQVVMRATAPPPTPPPALSPEPPVGSGGEVPLEDNVRLALVSGTPSRVLPIWLDEVPCPLVVVGAHPGAGSSSVAVALAEAAAARAETFVHLLDCNPATRSGLAAVTDAELGIDACGRWRYGRRGKVLVSRTVDALPPTPPDPCRFSSDAAAPAVTVIDLGCFDGLDRTPMGPTVVVFRTTLPGLHRLEVALSAFDVAGGGPVTLAAVGRARWPRQVRACSGPRLRQVQRAGLLAAVPIDRRLAVTGLSSGPLPRKVTAAGTRLWDLATAAVARQPAVSQPPPSFQYEPQEQL